MLVCLYCECNFESTNRFCRNQAEPCLPTSDRMFEEIISKQTEIKIQVKSQTDARFTSSQTFI